MAQVRIGRVKVGDSPRIVVTVTTPQHIPSVSLARTSGADIVELRLDYIANLSEEKIIAITKAAAAAAKIPVIATLRAPREGGARRDGIMADEKRKVNLLQALLPHVAAVDIELSSPLVGEVVSNTHKQGKAVIMSYHHFHSTPSLSRLKALANLAKAKGGDIVKIVTTTHNPVEMIRLFTLLHDRPAWPMAAFATGQNALLSRLMSWYFHSSLMYAGLPGKTVPGQPNVEELKATLKQFGLR
jgi:3-dehydroquinate dehydratase-1